MGEYSVSSLEFDDPWEDVANGIVMQAVIDYTDAIKFLRQPLKLAECQECRYRKIDKLCTKGNCEVRNALYMKADCENFFKNDCKVFTHVDGVYIMNKLRHEHDWNEQRFQVFHGEFFKLFMKRAPYVLGCLAEKDIKQRALVTIDLNVLVAGENMFMKTTMPCNALIFWERSDDFELCKSKVRIKTGSIYVKESIEEIENKLFHSTSNYGGNRDEEED